MSIWDEVIGQPRAVAQLQAAVCDPVHAYLFLGPAGAGKRAAALAFAAELVAASAADPDRARRLALAGEHPDVQLVEPTGAFIQMEAARAVIRAAVRPPTEASRKVLILTDFHLVRGAGPALLKTIEEPSESTVFCILADEMVPELVTIASRCLRVPFVALSAADIEARLVSEGVEAEVAARAAVASGGDLRRARLLATDPALDERRSAWRRIPDRLDGRGCTVSELVDELSAQLDGVVEPLREAHQAELDERAERAERAGEPVRVPREIVDRHKREIRRLRVDELRSGLVELGDELRRRLTTGQPIPAAARLALSEDELRFNVNERLLLTSLLLEIDAAVC